MLWGNLPSWAIFGNSTSGTIWTWHPVLLLCLIHVFFLPLSPSPCSCFSLFLCCFFDNPEHLILIMGHSSQWYPGHTWFTSRLCAALLSAYYPRSVDRTSGLSQVLYPIRVRYVHLPLLSASFSGTRTFQIKLLAAHTPFRPPLGLKRSSPNLFWNTVCASCFYTTRTWEAFHSPQTSLSTPCLLFF